MSAEGNGEGIQNGNEGDKAQSYKEHIEDRQPQSFFQSLSCHLFPSFIWYRAEKISSKAKIIMEMAELYP